MLNQARARFSSTNYLKRSKVTVLMRSEAISKLSRTLPNFFDMTRPICWIAESFQSNVLVLAKPPPRLLVNYPEDAVRDPEAALAVYGFSLFMIRCMSDN